MATSLRDPVGTASVEVTPATLEAAIAAGELVLHYQPKVDLRAHRVIAVEALVRWQQPGGRLVFPDEFIPLAETSGLMPALTGAVARAAFDQYVEWRGAGLVLGMAVNVSASLLSDPRVLPALASSLSERGISPAAVTLEVTESTVMDDPERALDTLRRISAMGVRISIDDFGTGYSSLAYLSRLPVNELKIDRAFVTSLPGDEDSAAIVRSTIGLSHALGHEVVAEGVETEAAYVALRRGGCDVAQGYLVSRPLAPDRFATWLAGEWPQLRQQLVAASGTEAEPAAAAAPLTGTDDLVVARCRAFQRLTRAVRPADVAGALERFVVEVGGSVVDVTAADHDSSLEVDISLGAAAPMMPAARDGSRAQRFLRESLPGLVESGRRMIMLLENQAR